MSTPIRPKNFREQVYFTKLRARVDGNGKVAYSLTQIRGIGRRFAQAIVTVAGIDPSLRLGALPEKDITKIEEIIMDPINNGIPSYLFNRKHDLRTGNDLHIIGNPLELTVKRDIDRMKRIKSYKGVRHNSNLKVRGQRTKSTGRHGLVIGVIRKKLLKKGGDS
ncbi:MAG: 30S ribosomal protein S13 [Promethearchaeota archaeon]